MIAFWHYDLYPYLLWGTIDSNVEDNLAIYHVQEYNFYVQPEFILENKDAQKLISKLNILKENRDNSIKAMRDTYDKFLRDAVQDFRKMSR